MYRSRYTHHACVLILGVALAGPVVAQHVHRPAPTPAPMPAGASKPVPSPAVSQDTLYRSVFKDYRRFDAGLELQDWRAVNRTVQDRGGWRAYAKEAAAPDTAGERK